MGYLIILYLYILSAVGSRQVLRTPQGMLTTNDYLKLYDTFNTYTWVFEAGDGSFASVRFMEFKLAEAESSWLVSVKLIYQ